MLNAPSVCKPVVYRKVIMKTFKDGSLSWSVAERTQVNEGENIHKVGTLQVALTGFGNWVQGEWEGK